MERLMGRLLRKKPRGTVERATAVLKNAWTRFGKGTRDKSEGKGSGKAVGLGISALAVLTIISLSVWLLRKKAGEAGEGIGEEMAPDTSEPEEE